MAADDSSKPRTLEERLAMLEDVHAISQLIAAFGPSVDSSNIPEIMRIWHPDSSYEIGGFGVYQGAESIAKLFSESDAHLTVTANGSGHISTAPRIAIHGDRASAINYGTTFLHEQGQFLCGRLTASRWEFERIPGGDWQIKKRTTILLDGRPEARELLAKPV